ncbi:MAG: hypothetical protein V2I63_09425 [Pseudomonadales bacterium]|jgi:hypothetical protein|nr:hypothetical protein [Pseudomonadales bacterium]
MSLLEPTGAARRLRGAARDCAEGRMRKDDYRRLRARILDAMVHGDETTRAWGDEDETDTRPGRDTAARVTPDEGRRPPALLAAGLTLGVLAVLLFLLLT